MRENTEQESATVTNLIDAGCSDELIEQCMSLLRDGKREAVLTLLAKHRRYLLDCYHAGQKKISCLDYFIFNLKKSEWRK